MILEVKEMHYYRGDMLFQFFNIAVVLLIIGFVAFILVAFSRTLRLRNSRLDDIERKLDEINEKISRNRLD